LSLSPGEQRRLSRGRSPHPLTRAERLTPGAVLKIMEHLDTRGRAILYVMVSSGARLGEVLSIDLKDLDLDSRPARFRIRNDRGGGSRIAFISREAAGAIHVYLIVRDRFAASARSRGGTADPHLLFPIGTRAFEQVWARALSKARLERFDRVTNRRTIPPGATRQFFAEMMRSALPEPVLRELMGNARHLPDSYRRYTEDELAGAYTDAEPAVTLHRSHRKERVERRISDLERLIKRLQEQIGEREEELAGIRARFAGGEA
ncbi:MAG: site-specific integrase, partial [Methanomicrobiales archaeon]|nr:site-specific integrase [Methanomicrobiales archaeon]